jgi:hypothetical protein
MTGCRLKGQKEILWRNAGVTAAFAFALSTARVATGEPPPHTTRDDLDTYPLGQHRCVARTRITLKMSSVGVAKPVVLGNAPRSSSRLADGGGGHHGRARRPGMAINDPDHLPRIHQGWWRTLVSPGEPWQH